MLAKVGVNWIPGARRRRGREVSLHDDQDSKKVKLGDEIATHTAAATINGDAFLRAGFHDYLHEQAKLLGTDLQSFLGVDDLGSTSIVSVPCPTMQAGSSGDSTTAHSGTATSPRSARMRGAVAAAWSAADPSARRSTTTTRRIRCSSPKRDMNFVDLVSLLTKRNGSATLGWGEDWPFGGSASWELTAAECTTFYARIVDCGRAGSSRLSGGFLTSGANSGYSPQKMFFLRELKAFRFCTCTTGARSTLGPKGATAWSEIEGAVLIGHAGTHLLGPADEIIGRGKREPRRTALLYNRECTRSSAVARCSQLNAIGCGRSSASRQLANTDGRDHRRGPDRRRTRGVPRAVPGQ